MKQKLHIVILDFDDIKNPLLDGGQARATYEVGRRLAERGYEIIVLCSKYPGYKDRVEDGIEYKHIGFGSKNIRLNNLLYIFAIPLTVREIKDADIILECFTAPISTLFSPLFTKIPVVALSTSFEADRFSRLYHLPLNRIEKFGARFYKYFIALSSHFETKMKAMNSNVISRVIPEGVGKEFFYIKKRKPKHVLFLGRFDMDQKGIDLLLHAYAKIFDKSKYPLVLVGKGPDERKISELIEHLNIKDKVSIVGPAYGRKKEKYLSESLFVAFPSRNETFSCFALEALASELPLVAFDIPGIEWTGSTVARKAKAFDIDGYSKLLLSAMNEKDMFDLGKKARKFASHFTWDFVAEEFEKFFFLVLKKEEHSYAK